MADLLEFLAFAIQDVDEGVDNAYLCAEAVAKRLTDDEFVAHAAEAVRANAHTSVDVKDISDRDLHAIVRVALSAVRGEA